MKTQHALLLLAAAGTALLCATHGISGSRGRAPGSLARGPHADAGSGSDLISPGTDTASRERGVESTLAERGPWSALPGSAFLFDVQARVAVELGADSASMDSAELSLAGRMRVEVLARREDELLVGVALPVVELRAEGAELAADELDRVEAQFQEASLVRMTSIGDTLGYRFPDSMEPETRNWIRTLVSASRFVIPEGHPVEWDTTETDSTGRFQAHYRLVDGSRVRKEKTRYLDAFPVGEIALVPGISGSATGELDPIQGWLLRSELEESTALTLPEAGMRMHIGVHVRIERAGTEPCAPDVASTSWDGPWESLDGQGKSSAVARADLNEDRRLLDGATLEDVLSTIEGLLPAGQAGDYEMFMARQKLAALVRLEPETLQALQELLVAGFLDDGVAEVALSAVGAAGTSASETFLSALAADAQGREAHRIAAVVSLFQLQHSSTATFETILDLASRPDASPDLGTNSLLLLGALATGVDGDGRADRLASLLALEESSRDASIWLRALGNCGGAQILEAVSPYLHAPEPDVRLSAVESLREVPGEPANELLAKASREDPDIFVRAAAAELLGQRWNAGTENAVRSVLEEEPASLVRSRALNGIAFAALREEGARTLLHQCSERDLDPAVRKHARELLAGMEG